MGDLTQLFSRKAKGYLQFLREALYGFTSYELHRGVQKEKGDTNNLFMLLTFGDLVGLPMLPPYYSMRLLPHIVPKINTWKRNLLKEKDITDILVD